VSVPAVAELPPVIPARQVGATKPFARGATAAIEEVKHGDLELVVKRFFRPETVDAEALRSLVRWRLELSEIERRQLDRLATWPLATIDNSGRLVGFLMHRVPSEFAQTVRVPSGGQRTVLREAQYLFSEARANRLAIAFPDATTRFALVFALIDVLDFLHQRRIVVGDLSTRNVLWAGSSARVLMVDCDSMFLGGVGSPLPPTSTVDWEDPADPRGAAASSDIYKLGLFALRVLAGSFQSRDPELAAPHLDGTGLMLLRASLSPLPSARPAIHAWERWAAGRRASLRRSAPINTNDLEG
jgi:hypothetical protein